MTIPHFILLEKSEQPAYISSQFLLPRMTEIRVYQLSKIVSVGIKVWEEQGVVILSLEGGTIK